MKVIVAEQEFYIDGYLKNALDTAKKEIRNDWDMVFVGDGQEGSGKSVLVMQCAKYCDPTLTIDNFAFTPNMFRKKIMDASQYQAIIYDEAHSGLNSRATMTSINKSLVSMMTEIRQKNLFVFVVLPTFFDLDKYMALWRSRALLHVYTDDNFKRGYFAFYNVDRKKSLYILGKKMYKYNVVRPNFYGRFTNKYVVDEEEYRKYKRRYMASKASLKDDAHINKMLEEMLYERVVQADGLTHKQRINILKMSESTYYYKLKNWREKRAI